MRINDNGQRHLALSGLSVCRRTDHAHAVVADALECCRKSAGRAQPDVTSHRADTDNRVQSYDKVWSSTSSGPDENRFRLVQQRSPASRRDPNMFDVLVRMIDHHGKEVLPSEFMAAASATIC